MRHRLLRCEWVIKSARGQSLISEMPRAEPPAPLRSGANLNPRFTAGFFFPRSAYAIRALPDLCLGDNIGLSRDCSGLSRLLLCYETRSPGTSGAFFVPRRSVSLTRDPAPRVYGK